VTAIGDIFIQNGCGQWLHFTQPDSIFVAWETSEVSDVLLAVEDAISNAKAVVGFLAYEAARGIDPILETQPPGNVPLAWFGCYSPPEILNKLPMPQGKPQKLNWHCSTSEASYVEALSRIKDYIREGDTYQVNFTVRLNAAHSGDPYALFYQLQSSQQSSNAAFINIGEHVICSVSPELFFELSGSHITARPMKGTARRGTTLDDDFTIAEALRHSPKDCAENVMIVDMIRNDIGRVARPGSVRVSSLFDVEHYPTVSQLTSTVEAETDASFAEIMRALFPCASITGAPKIRTMQIIRELESAPRGIYTGSIGYWLPGRVARFNVAIRTVVMDQKHAVAQYGVGGGIVWDSVPQNEYAECQTKAMVLSEGGAHFELLETLLWEQGDGYFLLDSHIQRVKNSAQYFGFSFDEIEVRERLFQAVENSDQVRCRVRCLLSREGGIQVELHTIGSEAPVRSVGLALHACSSQDPFVYHKTTQRDVYERARLQCPECDDVLLVNERGELTESTIANLVVVRGDVRTTPPRSSGLLAGTFRDALLSNKQIVEGIVTIEALKQADSIFLINSVRKWMPVTLLP
jgi:para-aminobenzoate synthetase/4-amino-4-deoxychorismate lyase